MKKLRTSVAALKEVAAGLSVREMTVCGYCAGSFARVVCEQPGPLGGGELCSSSVVTKES